MERAVDVESAARAVVRKCITGAARVGRVNVRPPLAPGMAEPVGRLPSVRPSAWRARMQQREGCAHLSSGSSAAFRLPFGICQHLLRVLDTTGSSARHDARSLARPSSGQGATAWSPPFSEVQVPTTPRSRIDF